MKEPRAETLEPILYGPIETARLGWFLYADRWYMPTKEISREELEKMYPTASD